LTKRVVGWGGGAGGEVRGKLAGAMLMVDRGGNQWGKGNLGPAVWVGGPRKKEQPYKMSAPPGWCVARNPKRSC